jgi:hypothetical protein
MGRQVIFVRPCIFHSWFSMQNKQGGVRMASPHVASRTVVVRHAGADRGRRGVQQRAGPRLAPFSNQLSAASMAKNTEIT